MVANLKSLLIPIAPAPTVDTSWLDNLVKSGGDAIDKVSQNKSFGRLADQISGAPATPPQPGFLSRLFGGGQQAAIPAPGAASQIAATSPGNGDYFSSIRAAESGGNDNASNPNSSAQGRYQFTTGTWDNVAKTHPELGLTPDGRSDPNQQELAIRAFTQDNAKSLASSGIPVTPGNLYAAHFLGAGGAKSVLSAPDNSPVSAYVDPGVVTANPNLSNMSVGQFKQWTSSKGGNGTGGYNAPATDAINAAAPPSGSVVAPPANAPTGQTQVASLDPGAGMARAPAPAPFDPATASPTAMMQQLGLNSPAPGQAPYRDPQVTTAAQQQPGQQPAPVAGPSNAPPIAPQQVAQNAPTQQPSGPQMLAPGVTTASRQNVSNEMISSMVRDPNTRQIGLQLWQQVLTGKGAQPWKFVTLDDGTLARANEQTGAVETIGQFKKPQGLENVRRGSAVYDPNTKQWITPPEGAAGPGGGKFGLQPIYGTDATTGKTGIGQIGEDGTFHVVDTGGFQPVGNVSNANLGTSIQTRDKAGNIISTSAIDNAGKSAEEASGKNLASNQQALPGVLAASNQLISTIDSLSSDPHLDSMLGPINSRLPTLTSDGERVQSKMDQIGGQTFLQAYNTLRGAGAITDIEGDKATKSLNRLNAAQSPQDYRAALSDFRDIVVQAATRARAQAGQSTGTDSAKPTGKTTSGVSWSIEQ